MGLSLFTLLDIARPAMTIVYIVDAETIYCADLLVNRCLAEWTDQQSLAIKLVMLLKMAVSWTDLVSKSKSNKVPRY